MQRLLYWNKNNRLWQIITIKNMFKCHTSWGSCMKAFCNRSRPELSKRLFFGTTRNLWLGTYYIFLNFVKSVYKHIVVLRSNLSVILIDIQPSNQSTLYLPHLDIISIRTYPSTITAHAQCNINPEQISVKTNEPSAKAQFKGIFELSTRNTRPLCKPTATRSISLRYTKLINGDLMAGSNI